MGTHKKEGYPCIYDTPLTGLDWLEYYSKHDVYHPGVDFNSGYGNDDLGHEVYAPKSGFVVCVHDSVLTSGGFGKFIIIEHSDGNFTRYAHLADIQVKAGQEIKKGKLIGHVGKTGTTYAHLHFEVFNKECSELQINHWRPWRMYPSGWTKAKVQKYYINPWTWLEAKTDEIANQIPDWAISAVTWAQQEGFITSTNVRDITNYELAVILKRVFDKLKK